MFGVGALVISAQTKLEITTAGQLAGCSEVQVETGENQTFRIKGPESPLISIQVNLKEVVTEFRDLKLEEIE